jgi:hypothetical protein
MFVSVMNAEKLEASFGPSQLQFEQREVTKPHVCVSAMMGIRLDTEASHGPVGRDEEQLRAARNGPDL